MAAEEQLLNLFDAYWFGHPIFTLKKPSPAPSPPQDQDHEQYQLQQPKISCFPTTGLHVRSFSDQLLSSKLSFSSESPKLQTILSGKEIQEFEEPVVIKHEEEMQIRIPIKQKVGEEKKRRRKREKIGNSKSLSDLEFEELKGFMDLGFVFSEEDRDSSLVSILPGLQRLGREDEKEEEKIEEAVVPRPYLSEAWDVLEQRKVNNNNPLMNWRVPVLGNDMDMKDHLKFWAHTVASTVR